MRGLPFGGGILDVSEALKLDTPREELTAGTASFPGWFGSDHVPFFSWVMAVGEPAVHLPGRSDRSVSTAIPLKFNEI